MVKGTANNPANVNIANWYHHDGVHPHLKPLDSDQMAGCLLRPRSKKEAVPVKPPPKFETRAEISFKAANPFSAHDQRYSIESQGEHLSSGTRKYGRRRDTSYNNLHTKCQLDRVIHGPDNSLVVRASTNGESYVDWSKTPTTEEASRRRFSKLYPKNAGGSFSNILEWDPQRKNGHLSTETLGLTRYYTSNATVQAGRGGTSSSRFRHSATHRPTVAFQQ